MREHPLFSRTGSAGPQARTFGPGPARRRPAASTQLVEPAERAKSGEPPDRAPEAATTPLEPTGPSQCDFMSQLREAAGYSESEPEFESLDESGEKGVSEMDDGAKDFARPAASRPCAKRFGRHGSTKPSGSIARPTIATAKSHGSSS
ncbi:MAG: hypothetical protein A49_13730 [Methyloceanibacter sp.]|nr:MAG: hypothetical protein A49_13730 [Methyloceanibacter sp.]